MLIPMEKMQYPRLTDAHLGEIRASVDWQQMFDGLGFKKCPKKSKPDDWWAYSPFHKERTPSFHMGPGGLWFDFSVGEGGGAIELVQRLRDVNCYEAAHHLINNGWASYSVSRRAVKNSTKHTVKKVDQVLDETKLLNPTIRQDLIPLTTYHDYLAERGISQATCEKLGIGFLAQGRSPLRERIVFQLRDARIKNAKAEKPESVILSHIGRAVSDDESPKYLFYEGFHKSAELIGQDRCWLNNETIEQIRKTGFILITEGPFDWAKCIEAGLLNVVATMGAQMSESQAAKLKLICDHHQVNRVLLAFDKDETGDNGARKAETILSAVGLQPKIFDWGARLGFKNGQPIIIAENISDLAQLQTEQLKWLRLKGLL